VAEEHTSKEVIAREYTSLSVEMLVGQRELPQKTFWGHISSSPWLIAVVCVISEGFYDPKVPKARLAVLGNQDIVLNVQIVNARG
jgi:hypothetical protein